MLRRALTGLVAAVAVALAGCGSDGRAPSVVEGAPLTPAQVRELADAEETLVARCMRGQGFEYHLVPADPVLGEDRDFPYGIDDPAWAARHGLGRELRDLASRQAGEGNPNERYTKGLPPDRRRAYTAALYGSAGTALAVTIPTGHRVTMPPDGCLAAAQQELYGDLRRWFPARTIVNNLAAAILPTVYAAQRFRQVAEQWSRCMAERGHHFRDPVDLRERFTTAPGDGERRVAVAEAECVVASRLAETGHRLERELGAPVRARYAGDIRAHREFQVAALPRAADLIGK
jgi:hypothetical protein